MVNTDNRMAGHMYIGVESVGSVVIGLYWTKAVLYQQVSATSHGTIQLAVNT